MTTPTTRLTVLDTTTYEVTYSDGVEACNDIADAVKWCRADNVTARVCEYVGLGLPDRLIATIDRDGNVTVASL